MKEAVARGRPIASVLLLEFDHSVPGRRGATQDSQRDAEREMLRHLTIVRLQVLQQVSDDRKARLGRVRSKKMGQPTRRVRHVLREREHGALEERRARDAGLDDRSVQQPLAGAGQESGSGVTIERWQLGPTFQHRPDQVDQKRRRRAGGRGPKQPRKRHPTSRTPRVEESSGEPGHA